MKRFLRPSGCSFHGRRWLSGDTKIDYKRDYWGDLGLKPGSSSKEIKTAYLSAMKKYHPDNNIGISERKQEQAKKKFILAQEANSVLSDPENLKKYEHIRKGGGRGRRSMDPYMSQHSQGYYAQQVFRERWEKERKHNTFYAEGSFNQPFDRSQREGSPGLSQNQYMALCLACGSFITAFIMYQFWSSPRAQGGLAMFEERRMRAHRSREINAVVDRRIQEKSLVNIYGGINSLADRSARDWAQSYIPGTTRSTGSEQESHRMKFAAGVRAAVEKADSRRKVSPPARLSASGPVEVPQETPNKVKRVENPMEFDSESGVVQGGTWGLPNTSRAVGTEKPGVWD